ncbi:MAG: pyridoxal phosphate-dependent aminotransferase [Synergistaceae bacterium]|jgi:aspartate aminotransferase/aminotransferase|nr:pyridoxal phosphate-dependent aminotransferase [Synergistaceae bacterium]
MAGYRLPVSRMRAAMQIGGIREIMNKAGVLDRAGKKVIHMEIGRPDYDSPLCAKEAAKKALDEGWVHYTDTAGTPELRRAIADAVKRDQGIGVDPDREIVVTLGAVEALAVTFFTLLEPGDEVIVPAPFFPAYADQIALAGGVLREVPCRFENGFRLEPADLEAAITPKTRMLLINSPNNPSGAVMTRSELSDISALARKYDILVVSDECYEKFLYEGEHVSIASLPNMRERTIMINSASKTFSMTGWRVGWLILPPEVKPYAAKSHQNFTSCATSFAQIGVAEALYNAGEDVKRMIEGYKERRDTIVARLRNIDGFEIQAPAGAFYVLPRVSELTSRLGLDTTKFAAWLLDKAGVAAVPGDVFHAQGNFLRMAYCRPLEEIHEAMDKIEAVVKKHL